MKKTLIATAVAAGVLATGAAQATPTVYGILHFSIDQWSDEMNLDPTIAADPLANSYLKKYNRSGNLEMRSNTSAIGIKGSEDLGGGLKAIYKAEFKIDPFAGNPDGGSLQRRDVWLGLKGGWGKVAAGTMSSNYKQMGGKIDPLYRTVAEARGVLNMQSPLHGGAGIDGGRMTQALQYTTPKMAGIEIVLNTSISAADDNCTPTSPSPENGVCDETVGAGIRWSNKNWLLYADYIDPNRPGVGPITGTGELKDESAGKIGGKWSNKSFQVGAQYEATEDYWLGDYIFLNGLWNINKKNTVTVSWGQQDKVSDSYNLGYVFKMSKQTNVYAAYGAIDLDDNAVGLVQDANGNDLKDNTVISLGIRKSF